MLTTVAVQYESSRCNKERDTSPASGTSFHGTGRAVLFFMPYGSGFQNSDVLVYLGARHWEFLTP